MLNTAEQTHTQLLFRLVAAIFLRCKWLLSMSSSCAKATISELKFTSDRWVVFETHFRIRRWSYDRRAMQFAFNE